MKIHKPFQFIFLAYKLTNPNKMETEEFVKKSGKKKHPPLDSGESANKHNWEQGHGHNS